MGRSARKDRRTRPGNSGDRGTVVLINTVLVGVGGIFLLTGSGLVAVVAAAAAVSIVVVAGR
jgi:hypothetical protein